MFPNNKVTCLSPWYEIRIDTNGQLRCCHALPQSCFETTELSFLDWFNKGTLPNKIRNSMRAGEEVQACKRCYDDESANLISFRERRNIQGAIYHNNYFKESLLQSPVYKRLTNDDKTFKPAFIHVSLSNLCNASCRTCFPQYSSLLTANLKKINQVPNDTPILLNWSEDPKKWENFLDLVKNNQNLLALHFMGGEPFYHKRFYEFVDWATENHFTNYNLSLTSNGTIFDEKLFEKLKKFKFVQIGISVENLSISNDYIRIGSSYNKVLENYEKYKTFASKDFKLVLRTVPQALSIENYASIIDFALENQIPIDSNFLSNPEYLKVFVLPTALKQDILNKLKIKYKDILNLQNNSLAVSTVRQPTLEQMKIHIESLIILLEEKEPMNIEELRKQFINFNLQMDQVSNLRFVQVYPNLKEFYEKYN